MRLTIDLTPEVERCLKARAQEQGVSLAVYVQTLIEQMVVLESPSVVALQAFEADMDTLAEGSETLPVLPPEAYSRESIFRRFALPCVAYGSRVRHCVLHPRIWSNFGVSAHALSR